MSGFLIPKSTAYVVYFKAFLSSDHVTEATGKTIAVTIMKTGATSFSNPAAGATNATECASGWYKVSLGSGDTDTVGALVIRGAVATIDDVGLLYNVVNATNGGLTALPDTACTTNASLLTSGTGTAQITILSGLVSLNGDLTSTMKTSVTTAVWDATTSGHVTAGTFGAINYINRSNTAQAGGGNTITLDASASATDNFYNNNLLTLVGGTGAGQARFVSSYVGATKVATLSDVWLTAPDNTSIFLIQPFPPSDAPTTTEIASAVLTTQMSEDYAVDGTAPNVTQALHLIQQILAEKSISSTTLTVKKLDGSTTAATFTLDSATAPTSVTRAS